MNTKNKSNGRKKHTRFIVMTVSTLAALSLLIFGLMTSLWWVVRSIVFIIGGIPAVTKIFHGQKNNDVRERNRGLAEIVITGAAIGMTFGIELF